MHAVERKNWLKPLMDQTIDRPAELPPIEWKKFCGVEPNCKRVITKPFIEDGLKFATNTMLLIISKTDEQNSIRERFPDVKPIFSPSPVGDWQPWPSLAYISLNQSCFCDRG